MDRYDGNAYEYQVGDTPVKYLRQDYNLAHKADSYPAQFVFSPLKFSDVLNVALHIAFCGDLTIPAQILFAMGGKDVCAYPACMLQGYSTYRCSRCYAVRYHSLQCRTHHHAAHLAVCTANKQQDFDHHGPVPVHSIKALSTMCLTRYENVISNSINPDVSAGLELFFPPRQPKIRALGGYRDDDPLDPLYYPSLLPTSAQAPQASIATPPDQEPQASIAAPPAQGPQVPHGVRLQPHFQIPLPDGLGHRGL
jgi:hypothetical protein